MTAVNSIQEPIVLSPEGYAEPRRGGLVSKLLLAYIFFLFSRVFEAAAFIGLGNLYLMLILSVASLVVVTLNGNLVRAIKTTCGALLLSFTMWSMLILPFSSWRSESLNVLLSTWLKSLAAFYIVAGLAQTYELTKKMFYTLGVGAVGALLLIAIPGHFGGDRFVAFGSMGNSNEVAFHLMLGLPFIFLLMSKVNIFLKVPLIGCALYSVVLSLKTASRAGLLMAGALVLISLLRLSIAGKAKLLIAVAVAGLIGFSALDEEATERFKTLFDSNNASTAIALSAKESGDVRKYKLQQSIDLTFLHPLFGVGMGVFIPASYDLSMARGEKGYYIASHNSFTQISSETGLIGFGIILAVFVTCYSQLLKLNNAARRHRLGELQDISICCLLAFAVLSIQFFFDSISYEYYVPMFAGVCTALIYTAKPLLAAAEVSERSGTAALPTLTPGSSALASAPLLIETSAPARPKAEKALRTPNPYRFGGRRPDRKP